MQIHVVVARIRGSQPYAATAQDGSGRIHIAGSELVVDVVVIVLGQADLFQIVAALGSAGGFPRGLDGRQQSEIRTAIIAITTNSSMSVKPFLFVNIVSSFRSPDEIRQK